MGNVTVALWICLWVMLSVSIIIVNKHVLYYTEFHFPFCLAVFHMLVATATSRTAMALLRIPDTIKEHANQRLYMQLGLIGVLFGSALVAGNAALLFLTVPTVQMLKAGGPATIYFIGIIMGSEQLQLLQAIKVAVVCTGVGIASYGDITLTMAGLVLQVSSIVMDAVRCCFLQKVLQQNQVKATPLVTLAHVAPFSGAALVLPMALIEGPKLFQTFGIWKSAMPLVALSGMLAAALNFVVFKIIGLTSALTTSLSGVIKEWACILVAMYVYGTIVTKVQWIGYSIAILGLVWYNTSRIAASKGQAKAAGSSEEQASLLKSLGPGKDIEACSQTTSCKGSCQQ